MPENWQSLPPYRQADVLRLKLLEKYGGIWMDASILLLENPDKFVGGDVTLFTTPGTNNSNPVYENWFIASTKNNEIIKKWIVEVEKAIKDPDAYLASSSEYNKKLEPKFRDEIEKYGIGNKKTTDDYYNRIGISEIIKKENYNKIIQQIYFSLKLNL